MDVDKTQPRIEPRRDADWEQFKDVLVQLYWEEDKELPEVMEMMAATHNFHATERQYKFRLNDKWKLEKNVNRAKMPVISQIRTRRRETENKETEFSLRGRPIPAEKIDRWEKRYGADHNRDPSPDGGTAASTPSGITYQTPRSPGSPPSIPDPARPSSGSQSAQHIDENDELAYGEPPFADHGAQSSRGDDFGEAPSTQAPVPRYYGYGGYSYAPHPQPPPSSSYSLPNFNFSVPPPPPQTPQYFGHGAPQGYTFQYSKCTGRKKALLIGINYFGQRGQLRGCINDVRNMSTYLVENFGYKRDDMVILTDDQQNPMSQPTKQNILRGMHWLVKDAKPNDSLFFHYSGHGGQTADLDGDEEDGYDEVIYPVDFRQVGHVTDEEMHRIMVRPLQAGVRLTAVFDSCHSGTALDLPYIYSNQGILKEPNLAKEAGQGLLGVVAAYSQGDLAGVASNIMGFFKKATGGEDAHTRTGIATRTSPADVVMFSGSKGDQTSADSTIASQATGAMSWAFTTALKNNPDQSYVQLLNSIRDLLQTKYTLKPQLSCSHPLDTKLLFKM